MKQLCYILLLITLGTAGYLIITEILFAEEKRIAVKGKLKQCFEFGKKEKFGRTEISCAYLSFTMLDSKMQFFTIKADVEDIAELKRKFIFSGIAKSLNEADEITVWVAKYDLAQLQPKIWKLAADEQIIYEAQLKVVDRAYLFAALPITILAILALLRYKRKILS